MWWVAFLTPGLSGLCGGEIGDCGGPPEAAHKRCLTPILAFHSACVGPAVVPCGSAAVSCRCHWL